MKRLTFVAFALAAAPALSAQQMPVGIGVHAGTLGAGADVAIAPVSRIQLRAGANFMPVKPSFSISDIDYTMNLPSPQFTVAADLFLIGSLHVSGGLRATSSDLSVEADLSNSTTTVDIGSQTYTGSDVGTLTGTMDTKSMAPYVGIGFGRIAKRGLGIQFDLGVAFQGKPVVSLTADGPLNSDPIAGPVLRQNLADEAQQFEDDVKLLQYYPIISLGLSFGF